MAFKNLLINAAEADIYRKEAPETESKERIIAA